MSPQDYLTTEEAAQRLGIGQRHVRRLYEEDRLPRSLKWNRDLLIHPQDVQEYLERREQRSHHE